MGLGKQAKILNPKQQQQLLDLVSHSRYPERDRVIVLLSYRAGLRVKEIALLTWSMVTDAGGDECDGIDIADYISLPNSASKGKGGGRTIPIHPELREALVALWQVRPNAIRLHLPVVRSERGDGFALTTLKCWFHRRYHELGMEGASSHSGRRTFITRAAKKITEAGGSLRDVQQLAGHKSLSTTQGYIEGDSDAKRRVIAMM